MQSVGGWVGIGKVGWDRLYMWGWGGGRGYWNGEMGRGGYPSVPLDDEYGGARAWPTSSLERVVMVMTCWWRLRNDGRRIYM